MDQRRALYQQFGREGLAMDHGEFVDFDDDYNAGAGGAMPIMAEDYLRT